MLDSVEIWIWIFEARSPLEYIWITMGYVVVHGFFWTRWCGSRIIEPLASRCAKFRFKPLLEDVMTNRIQYICQEEGLTLPAEVGHWSLCDWNSWTLQQFCPLSSNILALQFNIIDGLHWHCYKTLVTYGSLHRPSQLLAEFLMVTFDGLSPTFRCSCRLSLTYCQSFCNF